MKKLEHFKPKKRYAVFCPVGEISFDEMACLMSRAVVLCRKQKIGKLLIISAGVSGFHPPGISERYNLVERIASGVASMVRIAHVASPECVRSGKFDVIVAKNRGLDAEKFQTESAELEWLLQAGENKRSTDTSYPADRARLASAPLFVSCLASASSGQKRLGFAREA